MKSLLAAIPVVVVLGLTVGGGPASAKSYANVAGGVGDASAPEECGAGQYLVGVRIRSGAWWDQVTIACAAPLANGTFGPLAFGTPRGGTGGGEPTLYRCADNEVVISANLQFTAGNRQVAHAILNCASEETLQYRHGVGVPSIWAGSSDDGATVTQSCSPGEAATGFNVRFGAHVNALGMICDKFQRPAAPMAATVPAVDPAQQAAAQKALGDQITFERQVTGKTTGQCVASNAACEARLRNALGPMNAPIEIATQCVPFYQQCMTNAAAATAPDAPAPNAVNPPVQGAGKTAKVVQATDVYASAGGNGKTIGWLNAGATVTLVGTCDDNWCHVKGAAVPDGDGYVYSGPDYESLKY